MDERIEHVIVLMMENRSFDHLLGYLDHPNPQFPNLDRIKPSCPVDPDQPEGRRVNTAPAASYVLGTDPDHSYQAVMLQMFGREGTPGVGKPGMTGFIKSYARQIAHGTLRPLAWWERIGAALIALFKRVWSWLTRSPGPILATADEVMKCFPESEVPVLAFLAKQYAVLVNWFASVPGETWPNRQYAHAGTSHGTANIKIGFYTDDTVFQRLSEAGQRWDIYHDGVAHVWVYPKLWLSGVERFHSMDRFFADVDRGTLPAYAFIEPNHGFGRGEGNSQHPGNNTIKGDSFLAGEALMARIYNALVANPALFARTLLLITYDEHGGFFDHVPPDHEVSNPDGIDDPATGFDFRRTGVRVPAVAVSPLIPAGTVDDTFYDHASIAATVRRRFAPATATLGRREAEAMAVLDRVALLPAPRTDLPPLRRPEVTSAAGETATGRRLNELQASLVELAGGVRVARRRAVAEAGVRAGPPEVPAFVPDPTVQEAVAEGVLRPGSPAEQAVNEVVDDFTQD
jgi:phospholipase C